MLERRREKDAVREPGSGYRYRLGQGRCSCMWQSHSGKGLVLFR